MNSKKITCLDMDNVSVDFASGIARLSDETKQVYAGNLDDVPMRYLTDNKMYNNNLTGRK
jgi:hypothetical protein